MASVPVNHSKEGVGSVCQNQRTGVAPVLINQGKGGVTSVPVRSSKEGMASVTINQGPRSLAFVSVITFKRGVASVPVRTSKGGVTIVTVNSAGDVNSKNKLH